MPDRHSDSADAAREISYANGARSRAGRALIRGIENLTGRPKLIKMAQGYDEEVARGRDFWEVMAERYRLKLVVAEGELAHIPKTGPVVVVANHPFGILDGLMFGRILSMTRPDFKIMAHKVFHKAKDLENVILPIDFEETKEAQQINLRTRRDALAFLEAGGCIGVFPGGTVSTSSKLLNRPMDPAWKTFTAKMIQRSKATVVPVCFEGQNSRLFQIVSHAHVTLRQALLINEFDRKVGGDVHVRIGAAIPRQEIDRFRGDAKGLMDYLRIATYKLSRPEMRDYSYGLDLG